PTRAHLASLVQTHVGRFTQAWKRLFLRIDDVVGIDDRLRRLLDAINEIGATVSFEVIPRLSHLTQVQLQAIAGSSIARYEVGQHGVCHFPAHPFCESRSEFRDKQEFPTNGELHALTQCREALAIRFPDLFAGGFSPPFDSLPRWLPAAW